MNIHLRENDRERAQKKTERESVRFFTFSTMLTTVVIMLRSTPGYRVRGFRGQGSKVIPSSGEAEETDHETQTHKKISEVLTHDQIKISFPALIIRERISQWRQNQAAPRV